MFNAKTISELRKKTGLSMIDLSSAMSRHGTTVTTQTIWNWETGKTVPNSTDLDALSKALKKPVGYFFKGG